MVGIEKVGGQSRQQPVSRRNAVTFEIGCQRLPRRRHDHRLDNVRNDKRDADVRGETTCKLGATALQDCFRWMAYRHLQADV
jgi:hypothetical protein